MSTKISITTETQQAIEAAQIFGLKNRFEQLKVLSGAMDAWRERKRIANLGVDVVQAVRESRDSR